MDKQEFSTDVAGREMTFETGGLAMQANGSVLVRYGDSVVLATATASDEPRDLPFFPLRVDFEERQYAQGRIPGSFFRREGKPTDEATLTARLIDRPLRPLFPKGYRNDIQIVITTLSYDPDHSVDVMGMTGASVALCISDIPFDGPIAGVRVGLVDGELVFNPTAEQRESSDLDLVVAGTGDAVMMVEAGASEVPEEQVLDAILAGHEEVKKLCRFQQQIIDAVGKAKMDPILFTPNEQLEEAVREGFQDQVEEALASTFDRDLRRQRLKEIKKQATEALAGSFDEDVLDDVGNVIDGIEKDFTRRQIIEEKQRPDGRSPADIREIEVQAGVLPRAHGSGLFRRGQTQVMTVLTLGAVGDDLMLDSLGHVEEHKRYFHHYNFPPFSVGESKPLRAPSRREIGHGHLAERALIPVLPPKDEFPYTIRTVSEVLSSNGSTSQASVCGSSLALMDGGVPTRKHVAGIAMGLIKEGDEVVTLTDIQGLEDHLGDMDFKVAGTRDGVTAIQMDIKIAGVSRQVLERALKQAYDARMYLLDKMEAVISEPRPDLSPFAPRITVMKVNPDKISDIIGSGGKTINKIIDETGVKIDIEDDGTVFIASPDGDSEKRARKWIEDLTREVEVGEIFEGKVVRIVDFGAFVEILPNKDGLVHISKIADRRIPTVGDVLTVGDKILVKVIEIDNLGRINLSRQAALKEVPNGEEREVRAAAKD